MQVELWSTPSPQATTPCPCSDGASAATPDLSSRCPAHVAWPAAGGPFTAAAPLLLPKGARVEHTDATNDVTHSNANQTDRAHFSQAVRCDAPVVGIDLGTTNSAIAVRPPAAVCTRMRDSQPCAASSACKMLTFHAWRYLAQIVEDGVPRVISTADGRTTPSVVSFDAEGAVLVGKAAAE